MASFRSWVVVVCWVLLADEWLKGRVGDRLASWESGEVPCAVNAERMRSKNDSESGEVFFIDVESDSPGGRWCPSGSGKWKWKWKW